MKKLSYLIVAFALLFFACQNPQKQNNGKLKSVESGVKSTEYKTKSGKEFIVNIDHSKGASICDVQIETREFEAVNTTHKLGTTDPVEKVFIVDLDGNGFEEIYFITRSAGSGSYSNIYGVASNRDKSATPIYVPDISEKQMGKDGLFEGFMGHNKFYIENGNLVNSFPVYLENDNNSNPTGGKRKIVYGLIAGEAGWILKPQQIIR